MKQLGQTRLNVSRLCFGTMTLEQLEPALKALNVKMTEELYRELSALTPAPPPATDRTEEARE
jgi:aryl-alcohol dehydrogenase-like predicted oxidoreductase